MYKSGTLQFQYSYLNLNWWDRNWLTCGSSNSQQFIVNLESLLVPTLDHYVKNWRHFTDVYVKHGSIKYVWFVPNSFHDKIKVIYEQEKNDCLASFEILKN